MIGYAATPHGACPHRLDPLSDGRPHSSRRAGAMARRLGAGWAVAAVKAGRQIHSRVDGHDFVFDVHETQDGVDIAFTVLGSDGPTVILVNNPFVPGAGWRRFTTDLAKHNRLVMYDLRNQGASAAGPAGIDAHAADLKSLIEALPYERPYVVGHSIGCQICAEFAAGSSDLISGLVLAAPVVNPTGSMRRQLIFQNFVDHLESGGLGALFDQLFMLTYSDRAVKFSGRAGRWGFRQRFVAVNADRDVGENLRGMSDAQAGFAPDLTAIECPTLILAGDDDALSTPSGLRETRDLIGDAELAYLEGVGHNVYLEDNRAFQQSIQGFIERVESG